MPQPKTPFAVSTYRPPWHERHPWVGKLRGALRRGLFHFLRSLASTDDARSLQVDGLRNLFPRKPTLTDAQVGTQPYPDLGSAQPGNRATLREDVIIITARFRSGSTLLWNLFREIPEHTAYYEPFNNRRWFDANLRGQHVDPTHTFVDDYWREYAGMEFLGEWYRERWTDHALFMDADDWDPAMQRYVELLINHAPGRPVLQFNRIDFRLPWFRRHFPLAKIVHLYRHPRDQWCSTLMNPAACPQDIRVKDFARHDHYYLLRWAGDLKYHFPFLDPECVKHPYRLFYYVWKLSYLFGRRHADFSLSFEELTTDPDACLGKLFAGLRVDGGDVNVSALRKLIQAPKQGRWRAYADDDWFRAHETACEAVLAEFFRS